MSISGLITALATPFRADGALDPEGWQRLLAMQLQAGVHGVVVAGSTGEASTLSDEEYETLLRSAVAAVGGRMPVLAGTGVSGTAKTIDITRRAARAGATHALVVTPPYVRPTQEGLRQHYLAVAEQGGLPVVLYNVPGRTGCDLLPETVAELAAHPNVVAIKEAVSDVSRLKALLELRSDSFTLLSGDDATAARSMLAGADGLISVGSNALPGAYRVLCDLARAGDAAAAEAWDARLQPYHDFCGVESNPIPVKALLQRAGIGHGLRLPLLPLSAAYHAAADHLAADIGALEELSSH
ncbi:4-hydroxy-tetrahydrodipicolinate synthase [Stenotrophomonas pictorum JCM 9942]|uniref:4-hydroxy-tetrahydrodipicolinate synthase n=1 Tax=Stenotrophomonas pictorum JCM 9942 TaxID=1236960 RepID=A0A0R0AII8_9GAMM|nr:4-hydroxy-tetrahydrodipicolinate synthase [Stenotrophomonas pictorum]KRG44741.1 4-hydroxy-tetrahydrodipicolinate synthase [Stenotrophomonas pictorum JCM 9942]